MMKKLRGKLRGRRGESIAETLVALLISSLALLMLAGAITSANRVVSRSRVAMENYYATDQAMATPGGSTEWLSSGSTTLTLSGTGLGGESLSGTYSVTYSENDTFGSIPVISYPAPGA